MRGDFMALKYAPTMVIGLRDGGDKKVAAMNWAKCWRMLALGSPNTTRKFAL